MVIVMNATSEKATNSGNDSLDSSRLLENLNTPNNVKIFEYETHKEALDSAYSEAATTTGQVLSGTLFKQGNRLSFSTALPIPVVVQHVYVKAAKKGQSLKDIANATNRPTMHDHVQSIHKYIDANYTGDYIIPGLTLNVQDGVAVFVGSRRGSQTLGYLVIPIGSRLQATDGSHRTEAIKSVFESLNSIGQQEFSKHSIAAMITFENDISRIHQDFADCSRSKALPPSLVAAFDRRNPANGLVMDLIDQCEIFRDKVDGTSKTLGKKSTSAFLVNHVRQFVKELLFGNWAEKNEAFDEKAIKELGSRNDLRYKKNLEKMLKYTNRISEVVSPYQRLVKLNPGTERMKIPQFREEGWLPMTSIGLVILGRIGFVLIRDEQLDNEGVIRKLGEIDWKKSSEFWSKNVVTDGKIVTSRYPTQLAMKKVLNTLGIGANDLVNYDENKSSVEQIELSSDFSNTQPERL